MTSNSWFNSLCLHKYHQCLLGVVIDEAHCIVQWGGQFRPTYAKLNKLHLFVPMNIPLYITSATIMPNVLAEVWQVLHIDPSRSFHINLGNNRSNIYLEICQIQNACNFSCMDFLFENVTAVEELECALLFVNQVIDVQLSWQCSWMLLPPDLWAHVGFLHLHQSYCSKVEELEWFQTGKQQVLWVTEIGRMV